MSGQRFSSGKRFRWQGVTYEVCRLLPNSQVNIEDIFTGAVAVVELSELVTALFEGQLQFAIEGKQAKQDEKEEISVANEYIDLSDCPEHLVVIARYRLEVIQPLLEMEKRTRTAVEARVEEVKATGSEAETPTLQASVSIASIYRWLRDYTRSGYDLRALIPSTHRRGGQGQSRLSTPVNVLISAVIRDKYYVPEAVTIDDVVHEVAVRVEEENRLLPPAEQLSRPSKRTIARRIEALDMRDRFATRYGQQAARREFSQYGQTSYPEIPLERTEIDHTRSDFIVIDDQDNLPLGRLTLTYCLDMATRYPLGYYLGFEPPSYLAVMECLHHAIRPKGNVREKYGTEHDWIAYGIPSNLVIDNGKEFIGRDLKDACLLLGIVLQQTKVRSPEFKAGVERAFGSLNTMLFHKLPGTTFSNPQQRGDYDSVKQACVYLSEVDRLLNIFVVDIYAEQFHRGLQGIPARRWEAATGAGFFSAGLPPNAQELSILLGRVEQRALRSNGIEFLSLRYNCADLAPLRTRLKQKKDNLVKLKYHPADLSCIYVYDPFDKEYITVPALDQLYTAGLSYWKHRIIRNVALSEQGKVDLAALGRAKRKIQEIVDAGRSRKQLRSRARIARWDRAGQTPSRAKTEIVEPSPSATPTDGIESVPPATLPASAADGDPHGDQVNVVWLEQPVDGWELVYKQLRPRHRPMETDTEETDNDQSV